MRYLGFTPLLSFQLVLDTRFYFDVVVGGDRGVGDEMELWIWTGALLLYARRFLQVGLRISRDD